MSSLEIEDVLASIRRLVSDDLRPANRPHPIGKLMLTPALRVVPQAGVVDDGEAPLDRAPGPVGMAERDDWVPDHTTLSAVNDQEADHLDFTSTAAMATPARAPVGRSAMQAAAEAFHAQSDEFILSYSDTGTLMLRGDSGAIAPPTDHGAVFAVLNKTNVAVNVPPVEALADAEGGAPIEDEAAWSTVEWDDAPGASDAGQSDALPDQAQHEAVPLQAEVMQDDGAKDGPLILSFVSARRVPGGSSADVLTLRSPVIQVMDATDDRAPEDAAAEPLVLQRTKPKLKPKHLAAQEAAKQAKADIASRDDETASAADIAAALEFVEQNMAQQTLDETALEAALDGPEQSMFTPDVAVGDGPSSAIGAEAQPYPATDVHTEQVTDMGRAKAVLADAATEPDTPDMPTTTNSALGPWSDSIARGVPPVDMSAPDPDGSQQTAAESAVGEAPPAAHSREVAEPRPKPLHLATSRTNAPSKLAEAAFTRWPGWAQPDPGQSDAGALAPAEPPATPVPMAAETRRKPKAALQDLGWADRAEAEIHRQLAAELGPSVMGEVNAPALGLQVSEAALRDLVRDMIREELTGKLGERITQNVRKLVQLELQKSMSMHATEFRSQRRDPV